MTRQSPSPLEHRSLAAADRTMRDLVRQVEDGLLDLSPPYQRGSVWTLDQQMALVQSWLLGVPVPAIIVNDRLSNPDWERVNGPLPDGAPYYALIDGRQRVETGVAWFTGQLAVPASWFPADRVDRTEDTDDGPYTRFTWLTTRGQAKMRTLAAQQQRIAHVESIAAEAKIYLLINNSGTSQTAADLDRAAAIAEGRAAPEGAAPTVTTAQRLLAHVHSSHHTHVRTTTVNGERWLNEDELGRALRHVVSIPDGHPLGPAIGGVFAAVSDMVTGSGGSSTVVMDALVQLVDDAHNLSPSGSS